MSNDSDAPAASSAVGPAVPPRAEAASTSPTPPVATEAAVAEPPQISLALPQPSAASPAPASPSPKADAGDKSVDLPKRGGMPKAIEVVMKAAEAMKPGAIKKPAAGKSDAPPAARVDAAAMSELEAPAMVTTPAPAARANRFALLAASVALAAAFGATAGALGTSFIARPASESVSSSDLAAVREAIATLRSDLAAVKTSVEASNRRVGERLDRFAQAAPAQMKQTIDAIERLEKRAQAGGDVTGSVRQMQPVPAANELPRQPVLDGWVVRHVNRGVAIIQSRVGAIEVAVGDVVPGVGRIESIRRQEGRWVVLTSKGMIAAATPR